ncbi:MAG: DNA primase large subunit PriL [Candidatus Methanomethylicia archaeon]|nr:DNA primase large subunit PriL [Candidatus Methanomethylicia archaeon]
MSFSREDLAKYPFCLEAKKYISDLGFTLDEVFQPDFSTILDRVFDRIESAILYGRVKTKLMDPDVEILSFHITPILLSIIGDNALSMRYAVSEARRVYEELRIDEDYKLTLISHGSFNWKVKNIKPGGFQIFFTDFLNFAPSFEAFNWKLVNRQMYGGWVYVSKSELARLISEKVKIDISIKCSQQPPKVHLSIDVVSRIEDLKRVFSSQRVFHESIEVKDYLVESNMPPCVRNIMSNLLRGESLPHMARFTLATFLLNVGRSIDDVIKLFSSSADFDEKLTRYQVEHIAGLRGSRIKYSPPKCSTLKTFGLCIPDNTCISHRIKHPLSYHKFKVKGLGGESG